MRTSMLSAGHALMLPSNGHLRTTSLVRKQVKKLLHEKHDGFNFPLNHAKTCWDFTQKVISDNVACGYTIGDAGKNTTAYQGRWYNPPPRKPAKNDGRSNPGDSEAPKMGKKRKLQRDDPAEYARRKLQSERDSARARQEGAAAKKTTKGCGKKNNAWDTSGGNGGDWPRHGTQRSTQKTKW